MIQNITVIGAGSTGHYAAGLMSMRGFKVTLCDNESFVNELNAVVEKGGILLRGNMHGFGTPAKVTTNIAEAIPGAELIMVHVPADRHEEIARWIAPHLEDGQHIMIFPGNLGSFIFRKVFNEMGVTAKVTLTEKEGNLGPCRLSEPAEVTVGMKFAIKGKIASLPASDTEKVIAALEGVFEYSANKNVFEGVINAGNVINHVASTVLASCEIDRKGKKFSLFQYAFTPATVRCIEKIRTERKAVIEAMGMTERPNPTGMCQKAQNPENYPESRVFLTYMDGPWALDHRYLHEDCGCGAAFAISCGKRFGLKLPTLEAFLGVAGAINDRDYINGGRTLENLGFPEGMTMEEIYAQI